MRLCALCVCLVFGLAISAFAQWGADDDSDSFVSPPQVSAAPEEAGPAEEPVQEAAAAEDASESTDSDAAEASEDQAEDSEEPEESEEPEDEDVEPVQAVEPEPAAEAEIAEEEPSVEPVVEEAPAVKSQKARDEGGESKFRYGMRAGMGVSAFSGHKAIYTESFGSHAISLGALISASTGLVFAAPITDDFGIVWELQYSLYTAYGEFSLKTEGVDFGKMNEAGVELHSLEMPVLANYSFGGRYYAEVGPQFGANLYAKIYANSELKKPYLNRFAFGPALGVGVKLNDAAAVGVRGYFNVLEYAENSEGRPWTVQAGITSFFKCNR
jgi:hypothetical protein